MFQRLLRFGLGRAGVHHAPPAAGGNGFGDMPGLPQQCRHVGFLVAGRHALLAVGRSTDPARPCPPGLLVIGVGPSHQRPRVLVQRGLLGLLQSVSARRPALAPARRRRRFADAGIQARHPEGAGPVDAEPRRIHGPASLSRPAAANAGRGDQGRPSERARRQPAGAGGMEEADDGRAGGGPASGGHCRCSQAGRPDGRAALPEVRREIRQRSLLHQTFVGCLC